MIKQYLQLKLSQKLSPQQIQLMKLIQLPTQAFEQRLKQELEENPALESGKEVDEYEDNYDEFDNSNDDYDDNESIAAEDINVDDYLSDDEIPDYRTQANNYSTDDEDKNMPYAAGTSFTQYLLSQLNTFVLDDDEQDIAEFLVGSIDDSGYIRRELSEITDDLAFTQNIFTTEEEVEKILKIVHDLEPAGVGARNLQECLSIQLHRKDKTKATNLAIAIIDEAFEQFSKKHYKKLIHKFNITEDELKDAIEEIERLNPKPGGSYAGNNKIVEHIVPDFTIRIVDG